MSSLQARDYLEQEFKFLFNAKMEFISYLSDVQIESLYIRQPHCSFFFSSTEFVASSIVLVKDVQSLCSQRKLPRPKSFHAGFKVFLII